MRRPQPLVAGPPQLNGQANHQEQERQGRRAAEQEPTPRTLRRIMMRVDSAVRFREATNEEFNRLRTEIAAIKQCLILQNQAMSFPPQNNLQQEQQVEQPMRWITKQWQNAKLLARAVLQYADELAGTVFLALLITVAPALAIRLLMQN
ncbi:Oidioi.mRNA.OKI2018_I69.chr1.g1459.t1.cds [Oikopleura dioica]|uniref:Oidioi.mRNA.OKI2018_I69.chr1.g1459.t1.cds n=1 Tax=Oikopleura dioica TaxID=34765 RepID=A0ABN7SMZ4_OIKDI|nr:Oidioi.mRNA.OKI2018_I69.chr1.g1459.t1.cds [Oikopleura dioica]